MVGLHPCGHKNSRPPLPKYLPASASVLSSPSLCGSTYPSQQGPGVPSPTNLPLPGPNFLQALPNPAVQLNLLPESQPTPWIRSHLSLVSGTPSSILLCLLHRAPPASPPRDQEAGSVFGMKD